ncbi:hypothetical protein ACIP2X_20190 [Streptomyces sp. NPDC089424]|uniref:hypothetical protein n=1 Tax=Streptomyces sp. NPDC089424 TaxID=3365917 RepID=UPI0038096922
MPASRRGAAVLSSAVIALSLGLMPVTFQQAAAATPSGTHVGAATLVPEQSRDYRRGFSDGFKQGFRQGERKCDAYDNRRALSQFPEQSRDYRSGYKDGFNVGYRTGQRSC